MRLVVKIGTSSLTGPTNDIDTSAVDRLCAEVHGARSNGHQVVVVTSAAITAGLPRLGFDDTRPRDTTTLQAAAAVGQSRLLKSYDDGFGPYDVVSGQVLLSPRDFFDRRQYLHARATINRMIELGVVPIINENDAVSDGEIRWGDNDRLAALVAHAINADLLVLLTDTAGVFTSDPNVDEDALLVEEMTEVDHHLAGASGPTSSKGSGGMTSKLVAARMASRSGIRAVIAAAVTKDVVLGAIDSRPGIGTTVLPRNERISARKLWIGYALAASGTVVVDDGARAALTERNKSLLVPGIVGIRGDFVRDDGLEIVDTSDAVIAKGVTRFDAEELRNGSAHGQVVHRDDLLLLT